jgi:hypothetical protein
VIFNVLKAIRKDIRFDLRFNHDKDTLFLLECCLYWIIFARMTTAHSLVGTIHCFLMSIRLLDHLSCRFNSESLQIIVIVHHLIFNPHFRLESLIFK